MGRGEKALARSKYNLKYMNGDRNVNRQKKQTKTYKLSSINSVFPETDHLMYTFSYFRM